MKPGQRVNTEHGEGEVTTICQDNIRPYGVKLDTPVFGFYHAYYNINELEKLT